MYFVLFYGKKLHVYKKLFGKVEDWRTQHSANVKYD